MKKYPEYKATDQLWLPEIPETWDIIKIKYIFGERSEKGFPNEPLLVASQNMGVVPKNVYGNRTVEAQKDLHLLKLVKVGDFVISLRSFQGGIEYAYYQGIISPAYTIMVPSGQVNSDYFRYLGKSKPFIELLQLCVTGIREGQNVDYYKLKNYRMPIPSQEEQKQIVRYLDWQTSRINKLINAKKKQIALLEEQKQGIVNAIVLGGASENQERKDSGVAWIGQIPTHWDAVRCKYLFTEINDRSEEGLETHLSMSQKYGLVPDSMLDERRMLSASYAGGKLCREGDLVLNRLKAHLGVFALAPMEGVISPDYTVLRPNREYILPEFAEAVLKCTKCRPELRIRVRGIVEGFWRLYTDDFNTIYIPLPPIEEQRSIMQAIAAKQEHLNKLIKAINQEIELLQEYRTRLISDVVTGQVDVRDVVIPEYEAVQELAEEEDDTFADETEMEEE